MNGFLYNLRFFWACLLGSDSVGSLRTNRLGDSREGIATGARWLR